MHTCDRCGKEITGYPLDIYENGQTYGESKMRRFELCKTCKEEWDKILSVRYNAYIAIATDEFGVFMNAKYIQKQEFSKRK